MRTEYLDKFRGAYEDSFPYALDNRLMLNWYCRRIMESAKGDSLLELGLGHGYTTARFSEKFKRHLVLEGSGEVIRQFQDKFPACAAEIEQVYFEAFDTPERFDIIVMGFILEHVEDPSLILERFKRFLAPGGALFVAVPNSATLNKRFGYAAGMLRSLDELSEGDLSLGHRRLFTVQSLSELAESQGFRIKRTEGIFLKPITTAQIQTLQLSENILQAMLQVGVQYPELCVGILMELELPE